MDNSDEQLKKQIQYILNQLNTSEEQQPKVDENGNKILDDPAETD